MRKIFFLIIISGVFINVNAQKIDYNVNSGYAANGYDIVAYFSNKATKGSTKYSCKNDGIKYKFSSQENLDLFIANPKKYLPQYGGWCAYAMGEKGEKVSINPKTFEIRNGKLYLFYKAYFTNTLDDWLEEGAEKLKQKADVNWQKVKYKN